MSALEAHSELRTQYLDLSQRMLVCEMKGDVAGFNENNFLRMIVVQSRERVLDAMTTLQLRKINKGPRSGT